MKKWLAIVACAFALGACKRESPSEPERCPALDAGTPIDPLLLAFLSRARSAHHLADERENSAELAAAVRPLAELVNGPLPHGPDNHLAPEVREVLADTRARLADLRSRVGDFDPALADVRAGLENALEPGYFRGHLLETEGLVEERRAKALAASDPIAAKTAKTRAIELLEQAMAMQAHVIDGATPSSAAAPNASIAPTPRSAPQ